MSPHSTLVVLLNPVQILRHDNTVVCDALMLAAFHSLDFNDMGILTSFERL